MDSRGHRTKSEAVGAVLYIRVSTDEQARQGVSLDAQEGRLRAYCAMRGLEVVDIIRDEGVSAFKHLDKRPGGAHLLQLLAKARKHLRELRITNVRFKHTDGHAGIPEAAPFDAISVAAGAPEIPAALLEQLKDPGRLVIPVGDYGDQELRVVSKRGGRIDYRVSVACRFVPLRGGKGWE